LLNLGRLYYQRGESQSDAGRSEEAATTFKKAVDFLEESIRVSVGIAIWPEDGITVEKLVQTADRELYTVTWTLSKIHIRFHCCRGAVAICNSGRRGVQDDLFDLLKRGPVRHFAAIVMTCSAR
jgi:hypothetical protein